jgi:tripartite-type tricarboxylate transporter receptor subunit TctC
MRAAIVCRVACCAAFAATVLIAQAAPKTQEQSYPSRPIRLVIPFPPGGGADISGRIIGKALGERMGVQFVADNRPGASTMIATDIVAKATPDGHTLLMATGTHSINPSMFVKRPFDEIRDFTPIVVVSNSPNLVAVAPKAPIKTVAELIAYAKANPGKINFASGGTGSGNHLATEEFAQLAGIRMTHVPYKGSTAGITDLMSGQIQLIFSGITGMLPHHRAKRVLGIAVTSAKRNQAVPDLPAVAETLSGFESTSWSAILAPKGTPKEVAARWNKELNRILQMPDVKARMDSIGLDIVGGTQAHLREVLVKDIEKWKRVVKGAGIKL